MKYLFDADSIALLLLNQKEEAIKILEGESTLDLAVYEIGNLVAKESRLKKWTADETTRLVGYVEQVLGVMELMRIQLSDMPEIEREAINLTLSFFDASYITIAKMSGRAIVTEDKNLRMRAREMGVYCLSINEMDSAAHPHCRGMSSATCARAGENQ